MKATIGLRREDKSPWERRVPLTPSDAHDLQAHHGLEVIAQNSGLRIFEDDEYTRSGIAVQDSLTSASTILGVKEIPLDAFEAGKSYVFFAHVIKGQPYNMPMLKKMMELGCNLIDYEKVTDDRGRRLIFFGRHAGLAGMINTLWAYGLRLAGEGTPNPFSQLQQARHYKSLSDAIADLERIGQQIKAEGLPQTVAPLLLGIAGYGNVSRGAQEILEHLPVIEIAPEQLAAMAHNADAARHAIYKTVFKEEHIVEPISADAVFELQDYYQHPEKYRSKFETYLPHLTVLVNAVYWDARYPRLVTKDYVRRAFNHQRRPKLQVIGDISCDVEGAIEVTVKSTEPGDPIYVYDPQTDQALDGYRGHGPVIMAVDILPSELPREASVDFSRVLKDFLPAVARADFSLPFEQLNLPPEIKRAVILHQGQLTPDYRYLEQHLS
ncbi:MAG: bifunctional lysine ketoglutarate reductase /saccharopine dehydrogenase family protein [Chloroflexota bacterium]